MVGSVSVSERSKEAVGMMALHEALRNVCINSDWTYSVFWTIRPRPRSRGGNGCKVGDDNGSLMLMWEDGFCKPRVAECLEDLEGEDPVRKVFSKMSIQLYNYGEGLMGKVASDKCHKWVFKEPTESEPNISNYWQSSFDALPTEWTDQFASGIQTIAVIQAGHGLLQLGSCNIIAEDLHFVLRMRHTFESLGYQSGFFLSQLFSAAQTGPSPSSSNHVKPVNMNRPLPILNWNARPVHHGNMPSLNIPHPNFSNSSARRNIGDEPHLFLPLPHAPSPGMDEMITDHENDIKWPNGLSFFSALTGRVEESKLLFGSDSIREFGNGSRTRTMQQFGIEKNANSNSNMSINGSDMDDDSKAMSEGSNAYMGDETSLAEYLSLESHGHHNAERLKRMERFKRSFTMPARMASAEMTHVRPVMDYRTPEPNGVYSDIMGNFLE